MTNIIGTSATRTVICAVVFLISIGSAQSQQLNEKQRHTLFKSCIMAGGADTYTANCYEHLLPEDVKNIEANTFEFREALFRVCGKMSGGKGCCDHLKKEEQGQLKVCGGQYSGSYESPLDRCPAGDSFCNSQSSSD